MTSAEWHHHFTPAVHYYRSMPGDAIRMEQLRHVYRKGKTNTVRVLATILRCTRRRAIVAGHDVSMQPVAACVCITAAADGKPLTCEVSDQLPNSAT